MTNWRKRVNVKHLFTEEEDYDSVQDSMNKVANTLERENFPRRLIMKFRTIPEEYSLVVANSLLEEMFDYADRERIWLE